MSEPWCWHPDQVARLTDYQVLAIREAQNRRMELATKQQGAAPTPTPQPPTPTENVRCGAAYEYLISSGMSPDEAERVIRRGR